MPTIPSPQDQPAPDPNPSEGRLLLDVFGTLVAFQVRSAETNGAYAILEMTLPADRATPPMYAHAGAETFQILDGELEFRAARDGHTDSFRAAAGDIVHLPPNIPRSFRNVSRSPSSLQLVLAPGAMEGYFLELGTWTTSHRPPSKPRLPPDLKLLAATGRKYGIQFIDPE